MIILGEILDNVEIFVVLGRVFWVPVEYTGSQLNYVCNYILFDRLGMHVCSMSALIPEA